MVSPVVIPGSRPQPSTPHQYGTRIRSNSVIKPSVRLRQSPDPPPPPRRIKPVPVPKSKAVPVAIDAQQTDLLAFPPEHVMLHADDANSKVFLAIGRSFMSVDNRAMTIKDLAEMTMKYGLMCQNVSAAGQAITTYIRTHLHRCEVQEDHPLLLRHVLSGTAFDDELVPALHSRVGGAHCMLSTTDTRLTNFRRGTMVWYLSKAAGAPCPFARAGIRLSEYTENGKLGCMPNHGKERKRERDRIRRTEQCGQKRKRLLRACADKGSDSDSISEEEKRPPKVKLTLRLRPSLVSPRASSSPATSQSYFPSASHEIIDLSRDDTSADSDPDTEADSESDSDSDSDMMSVSSSGQGSEVDLHEDSLTNVDYARRPDFHSSAERPLDGVLSDLRRADYRRSPSVPYSVTSASPPPDSEDEDDFHISMTGFWRTGTDGGMFSDDDDEDDEMGWNDSMFDFDADTETQWESPGPRSPSVQFEDEVVVKQEPNDVGGFLDAWDDLDRTANMKVLDVIARAAIGNVTDHVRPKQEDVDMWLFDGFGSTSSDSFSTSPVEDDAPPIKEEELDSGVSFLADGLFTPPPERMSPASPISPVSPSLCPSTAYHENLLGARRSSDFEWRDAELLGPDSVKIHDLDEGVWLEGSRAINTVDSSLSEASILPTSPVAAEHAEITDSQIRVVIPPPRLDLTGSSVPSRRGVFAPDLSSPSLLSSLTSLSIRSPTSPAVPSIGTLRHSGPPEPTNSVKGTSPQSSAKNETHIIHTCQPCDPAISVRQLEGINVYQMALGSSLILRRVDTDFVNVTAVIKVLQVLYPHSHNAVIVARGSPTVCGTWVQLVTAQEMFKDHHVLSDFLSDDLHVRFPPGSLDSTHSSRDHFGPNFQSTTDAKRRSLSSHRLDLPAQEPGAAWERGHFSYWDLEGDLLSAHPTFGLASPMLPTPATSPEQEVVIEAPLSPTEEEMFRVLCSDPEWETPNTDASAMDRSEGIVEPPVAATDPIASDKSSTRRPLRRSKRVANAIANRSRTRSSKRGSRSSLS